MTEKEILKGYDITVHTFNDDLLPDEVGFYDPKTRTAFISDKLNKRERMKVLLHELGHLDHTTAEYNNARVRCMEYYQLTTVTDEIMIKEEYKALI